MRRIALLLFTFSFFATAGSAQKLFPIHNSKWLTIHYDYDQNTRSYYLMSTSIICTGPLSNDTIIMGKSYAPIYSGDKFANGTVLGAMRLKNDSENVVFFVPPDSSQEYLLYDFTKKVGDTIFNVYQPVYRRFDDLKVYEIDTIQFFGNYKARRFRLSSGEWYENIGSDEGLLCCFRPSVSGIKAMNCMCNGDTMYYKNSFFPSGELCYQKGDCSVMLSDKGLSKIEESFLFGPNPVNDFLSINSNVINTRLKVLTLTGACVSEQKLESGMNEINVSMLPEGMYIAELSDDKRYSVRKIVIQH